MRLLPLLMYPLKTRDWKLHKAAGSYAGIARAHEIHKWKNRFSFSETFLHSHSFSSYVHSVFLFFRASPLMSSHSRSLLHHSIFSSSLLPMCVAFFNSLVGFFCSSVPRFVVLFFHIFDLSHPCIPSEFSLHHVFSIRLILDSSFSVRENFDSPSLLQVSTVCRSNHLFGSVESSVFSLLGAFPTFFQLRNYVNSFPVLLARLAPSVKKQLSQPMLRMLSVSSTPQSRAFSFFRFTNLDQKTHSSKTFL